MKLLILCSLVLGLTRCSHSQPRLDLKGSRAPQSENATPGKPLQLTPRSELSDVLNSVDANTSHAELSGGYVYNDLWCSADWLYEVAKRSRLIQPQTQSIKLFFRDDSTVRVQYPGDGCTVIWDEKFVSRDGTLTFLGGQVMGGTCAQKRTIPMRPMVSVYDKRRNKYLLVDEVAPRPDACYQVYELIPQF